MPQLDKIGAGVWVWIQPDGSSGVSNAAVIADDDGLTVIDTLMVPSQWEPFRTALNSLDIPVRRVILTHAHIDHVGGTSAFPLAAIYGSAATSTLLTQPPMTAAYKAFMPAFAEEFDDLEVRQVTHVIDASAWLTPRIEVRLTAGHTDGDVIALVDDAGVLFAGDLCFFGVTPLAFQGDPATWADVLDAIADLQPRIVPGHGPVGTSADAHALASYLRFCTEAEGDPSRIPPGPWDTWVERDPRDAINVERAAMLARGDAGIPPTMLKAIGMA
ncbi:MAG: MBL fold metallo-hydrolase [Actinobacteria bacterium]|nr:MBL fold metallo-hydrolase [Actinomycetota bacterium]